LIGIGSILIIIMFKKYLKSKDLKVLIENFLSLSSLQLFSMILPLIVLPYILRVLGYEIYGLIMFANSFIAYFISITDFSFRITATRDISVFKDSQIKLSVIFSKVLIIKSLFLLISFLLIFGVVYFYPPFYKEKILFFSASMVLLGNVLFPDWFFQGIEKMKYITITNIIIKIIFTAFIFIFINDKSDYLLYPIFFSTGQVIAGVVGLFIAIKKYNIRFLIIKPKYIKKGIKENFPIFINQFVPNLYNNTSTFLLGFLYSTDIIGVYVAIKKIIDLGVSLIGIVSRVFFPLINRKKEFFNKFKKIMLTLVVLMILIINIFNKLIFWYLDVSYIYRVELLLILSLGLLGYAFYEIWGVNYFIIRRKDVFVMKNTIKTSIIGIVLAFPLVFYFGIIGSAINLSLTRLILGGSLYFKSKNYEKSL